MAVTVIVAQLCSWRSHQSHVPTSVTVLCVLAALQCSLPVRHKSN